MERGLRGYGGPPAALFLIPEMPRFTQNKRFEPGVRGLLPPSEASPYLLRAVVSPGTFVPHITTDLFNDKRSWF
ncbi:hypothetical protein NDU88_000434 [Pleurodeles waltl]|uniref:Uncharacterized protein n=1 Tax=Pleurodeles waltl TaxID=8319 RepID=A0AAV7VYE6_PLEWA|nr:hypothetical protein NDU88_000434 [Pleurodeles waltl]